jgi:lysophospholipase L1-like esterase
MRNGFIAMMFGGLLLHAACTSPGPARTVQIAQAARVVVLGDSITLNEWYLDLTSTFPATWLNSGVSGSKAADAVTNKQTLIIDKTPTVGIIELGVNDALVETSLSAFTASYQTLVDTFVALGAPVIGISILSYGELVTGGTWGSNAHDAWIAQANPIMKTIVEASAGGVWVDVRAKLLDWEIAYNPSNLSGNVFCGEDPGVHPTTAGKSYMSTWAAFYIRR